MDETNQETPHNGDNIEYDDSNDIISIQAKIVFGLNINVIGNVHFGSNDHEVIYPVEGVVAFHDYNLKKQKFLRLRENIILKSIVLSPNRKYIGILEQLSLLDSNQKNNDYLYSISIYHLTTLKKRRTIDLDDSNLKNCDISLISFTFDSKGIIVLTKRPNEKLFLYLFDTKNTIIKGYPKLNMITDKINDCTIECLAFNTKKEDEHIIIIIGGKQFLCIMKEDEKGFLSNYKNIECYKYHITTIVWLQNDTIVAGTKSGLILFIRNNKILVQFNGNDTKIYDVTLFATSEQSDESVDLFTNHDSVEIKEHESVLCMKSNGNDFLYSIFNSIYIYKMTSELKFERRTMLYIEFGLFQKELYQIMNISINFQQNKIICTAKHAQIYIGDIYPDTESYKTIINELKPLGENLHTDEIVGLSVCAWRPIIMTASKDHTVRIWNYETETVELVKKYQVDITMVELDPMGILAILGFWNQLRIMKIYVDDLIIAKTYNFPDCREVEFSSLGQFIAVAYGNLIAITSICNFEIMKILKGHFANVLSVSWSKNDRYLASGGEDGAIYLWNVETGTRIQEYVRKGIQYPDVKLIQNNTIYALTDFGTFYEIFDSKLKREIKPLIGLKSSESESESNIISSLSLLKMTVSRSEQILFLSSNQGHILNIPLPFRGIDGGKITNFRYFSSAVTKMKITYDDMYLITASKAGTLAIWHIINNCGKSAPIDQDLLKSTEILAPRKQLLERIETINDLEKRIKQIITEFRQLEEEYEIRTKDQIDDIIKNYEQTIEQYKIERKQLNDQQEQEIQLKNDEIEKLNNDHTKNIKQLIEKYKKKLNDEQDKIRVLQEIEKQQSETYDDKLKSLANCSQETIQAIENDFRKQIQSSRKMIEELIQELDEKKLEHKKYCEQVEIDNDRHMIELQLNYEEKLKNERNQIKALIEDSDLVREKYNKMYNEWKEMMDEIKFLKDQQEKCEKEIEESRAKIKDLQENEIEILVNRCSDLEKKILEKNIVIEMKDKQIYAFKELEQNYIDSKKCQHDDEKDDDFLGNDDNDNNLEELKKFFSTLKSAETKKYRNVNINAVGGGGVGGFGGVGVNKILKHDLIIGGEINDSSDIVSNSGISTHTKKLQSQKYLKKSVKSTKQQITDDAINNLEVEHELLRQRTYLENKIEMLKNQRDIDKKHYQSIIDKLMKDKSFLIKELNKFQ